MTTSPKAISVSKAQVKLKKKMREIAPLFSIVNQCIDECGDCKILKGNGIRHVMLGDARAGVANAYAMFEAAYAELCSVHNSLTDMAEDNDVDLKGVTFNGDGGR